MTPLLGDVGEIAARIAADLIKDGLAAPQHRADYERSLIESLKALRDPSVAVDYYAERERAKKRTEQIESPPMTLADEDIQDDDNPYPPRGSKP